MLFGGSSLVWGAAPLADTWVRSDVGWTPYRGDVHPSGRALSAFGFDPVSRRLILYGGSGSGSGETWAWNGSSWEQLAPKRHPQARADARMAIDPDRGRLLLFGGLGRPNEQFYDTWEWEGDDWRKLAIADAPFSGSGGGLAFDPISRRLMLVGFPGGQTSERRNWFLQNSGWVAQPFTSGSLPFGGFSLFTDQASGRVVLFGGSTGSRPPEGVGAVDGQWSWDGSKWVPLTADRRPAARWKSTVADLGHGSELLFGGATDDQYQNHYALDDTWTWRSGTWTQHTTVTTHGQVEAVFTVAVVSANEPPAGTVFKALVTAPDGTTESKQLCVRTRTDPCEYGAGSLVWRFDPITSPGAGASYRVLYGQGNPDAVLAEGTVDLLHSRTYYAQFKG